MTVVNVNEPRALEDDEAATDEDQAVTVDVLANDTAPDGDRLWVESVSAAAHGTATVTGGGVLYTPEPNYHGMDRFTYAVSDGNGGTAEATVEVTVAPVNDAPEPVGVIPDQMLGEGDGEATVELGPFFEDIEEDALTFRASSSNPQVAAVTVSGAVLTLTPVVYGSAAVTVTAEDPRVTDHPDHFVRFPAVAAEKALADGIQVGPEPRRCLRGDDGDRRMRSLRTAARAVRLARHAGGRPQPIALTAAAPAATASASPSMPTSTRRGTSSGATATARRRHACANTRDDLPSNGPTSSPAILDFVSCVRETLPKELRHGTLVARPKKQANRRALNISALFEQ